MRGFLWFEKCELDEIVSKLKRLKWGREARLEADVLPLPGGNGDEIEERLVWGPAQARFFAASTMPTTKQRRFLSELDEDEEPDAPPEPTIGS